MCLVVLAWGLAPGRLVLAGNRDEFHRRPAAAMDWWDAPPMLAGRDLEAGGTWLGVGDDGRFGVVTNFRSPPHATGGPSRGALIPAFFAARRSPAEFLAGLAADAAAYAGFSLLLGDRDELAYWSNRDAGPPRRLAPGLYGLSNGLLDSPWPKVVRTRERLRGLLAGGAPPLEELFALMADRDPAPDHALPDTGVGAPLERFLSPPFVVGAEYGTRCTTAVAFDGRAGRAAERGYAPDGSTLHTREFGLGGRA